MVRVVLVSCLLLVIGGCSAEGTASAASSAAARCAQADDPIETFSFVLPRVPFGKNTNGDVLGVTLSYRYQPVLPMQQLPDDQDVAKVVEDFLDTYPTPGDFLEQVNRKLNARVLAATPTVIELTTTLTRESDRSISGPIASTLTAAPDPCHVTGATRTP